MSILYKIPFIPLGPRPELCQWPAHHRRNGNRPAPTLHSYRMSESVISIWPKARVGTLWRYKRYKPIPTVRNPARPDQARGRQSATGQFDGRFMTETTKNGKLGRTKGRERDG